MTTPLLTAADITTLGSLRILKALAELTRSEARTARAPQVATEALEDTIEALEDAIGVLERVEAFTPAPHPDPIVELRAQGARLRAVPTPEVLVERVNGIVQHTHRAAPIATCACDLWPLDDLEATCDDGVTVHAYVACVAAGTIIAKRAGGEG